MLEEDCGCLGRYWVFGSKNLACLIIEDKEILCVSFSKASCRLLSDFATFGRFLLPKIKVRKGRNSTWQYSFKSDQTVISRGEPIVTDIAILIGNT